MNTVNGKLDVLLGRVSIGDMLTESTEPCVEQYQGELNHVNSRIAELRRERQFFSRLHFSTERIDDNLRYLELRKAVCLRAIAKLRERDAGAVGNGTVVNASNN